MKKLLRLLFIGDIVGPTGCAAVKALVPVLRKELRLDAVLIEADSASGRALSAERVTREISLNPPFFFFFFYG